MNPSNNSTEDLQQNNASMASCNDNLAQPPHAEVCAEEIDYGEFEDPYEDEFESEDELVYNDNNEKANGDEDVEEDEEDDDDVQVYMPGAPLQEGEELVADTSVYEMLHVLGVEWPALSFDVLRDGLGNDRTKFPHVAYMVAGSQADDASKNRLTVMKLSNLTRVHKESSNDSDYSSSDDDDDDDDEDNNDGKGKPRKGPLLISREIAFRGGVNRIRAMRAAPEGVHVVAAWSDELRRVEIFDVSGVVADIDNSGSFGGKTQSGSQLAKLAPVHKVMGHRDEGFALDWSALELGSLVSGDTRGRIKLTCAMANGSGFSTTSTYEVGNAGVSVEDLQWSPTERTVFAACATDGLLRVFDTRMANGAAGLSARLSGTDVNVISWNKMTTFLMASGDDNGVLAVWDLRSMRPSQNIIEAQPAARFTWHQGPVTSVEWHTHEESMIAASSADHQVTLWDLATESDETDRPGSVPLDARGMPVPPQLLFVHQGQQDVKELHWHPQISGCAISTGATGFNIFKTVNS